MSRYVEIENKKETYKLEYNRDAIIMIEDMGFDASKPIEKPYKNCEALFIGGLKMHHPNIRMKDAVELANEVISEYGLENLLMCLFDLYSDALHFNGSSKKKLMIKG